MKILNYQIKKLIYLFLVGLLVCSCNQRIITIEDSSGALSQTNSPVSVKIKLNESEKNAAKEGRLGVVELPGNSETAIPVQVENSNNGSASEITFLMPGGKSGVIKFKLVESKLPLHNAMKATIDSKTGQVIIVEKDKKVLQYNYQTVYEKDVVRLGDEKLEEHIRTKTDTFKTTSIYAVPRSDYIHPLYGLEGEMLTRDWPDGGHPHHRAIFWAWPEVEYGSQRGDIYALQRVFARPTGNVKYSGGSVFAQIIAENLWMWEDSEPIVREFAVIKIYKASKNTRIIDLTIKLDALKDSVTIATRGTNSYGGLNVRLQTPNGQDISFFTDKNEEKPQRAWSDFNGVFNSNESTSGLMILQHKSNPEYPGEWRDYPNLAWVQPTFPTPNTRYSLSTTESLVLHYRLIIHKGGRPDKKISEKSWDAYHKPVTPIFMFDQSND